MSRSDDGEVAAIESQDLRFIKPLSDGNYRGIDKTKWQIAIPSHQLTCSHVVISDEFNHLHPPLIYVGQKIQARRCAEAAVRQPFDFDNDRCWDED